MAKNDTVIYTFLNPFDFGVSYKMFLDSVPSGMSIQEYCEGHLSQEEIDWVIENIK